MSGELIGKFAVRFGSVARTLLYDDEVGRLEFTFDIISSGNKQLTLELSEKDRAADPRRYKTAAQRTQQYLESCGYTVEVIDPIPFDHEAAIARGESYQAKLIAEGKMIVSETRSKIEPQPSHSLPGRFFSWCRVLFK